MASTATQPAISQARETIANPIIAWHLLSLDAPTVAAVWACFVARSTQIRLPISCCIAMFLAVWILYAADRLLDARCLGQVPTLASQRAAAALELRHIFHHRYRRWFLPTIVLAAAVLLALLPSLPFSALRLYILEGALLLGWLAIVHGTRLAARVPKEFVVGAFFAAAVFIPSVARHPELRIALLPDALLFAALCTLNCLFIHAWESDEPATAPINPVIAFAAKHLTALSSIAIATAILLARTSPVPLRATPIASFTATALLLALHCTRARLSRTALRAAADIALLTPLLLLPFLP